MRRAHPLSAESRVSGKAIVPFGFGVVFTNTTRKQFVQTDLYEMFPEDRCVFKDEMSESADAGEFRAHLWKMRLVGRRKAGYEWGEMAVLYPEHWIGEKFAQILKRHDVPVDVVKEHKNRVSLKRPAVRLLSMHTAKGLAFRCVGVVG